MSHWCLKNSNYPDLPLSLSIFTLAALSTTIRPQRIHPHYLLGLMTWDPGSLYKCARRGTVPLKKAITWSVQTLISPHYILLLFSIWAKSFNETKHPQWMDGCTVYRQAAKEITNYTEALPPLVRKSRRLEVITWRRDAVYSARTY